MSEFWLERPTFVTGAMGLVGSHLVQLLIDKGAEVVCLVRDWNSLSLLDDPATLRNVHLVTGDVCDQSLLERVLGEYEIDTVFHLAAQAIVGVANRNPASTWRSNVSGTWSLLEACRHSPRVKQIVTASSDKAYGSQKELPYREEAPLAATHPYDVSKACSDLIAQSYAATFDLPVTVTRCGNFFGPGDLNWNRIVPGTIRSVLRGRRPVIRSDGKFVRDYFYVEDGAAAYLLLAERLAGDRNLRGEAFNFSNERPITVCEIVAAILRLMESDLQPEILNEANHEIRRQFLAADKARSVLGWQPRFSLEAGLNKTIDWCRQRLARPHVRRVAGPSHPARKSA